MQSVVEKYYTEFREVLSKSDTPETPAIERQRLMEQMNFDMGCKIAGNKPVPCYLTPYVISSAMEKQIQHVTELIMNALEKATELYFTSPQHRSLFELSPEETLLAEIHPHYPRKIILARLDAFIDGDRIIFIEFNCDSPGGMDTDLMAGNLLKISPFKELAVTYGATRTDFRPQLLATLVEKYHEMGGSKKKPNIALLADDKGHTFPEFLMLVDYFNEQGYKTAFGTPWGVEYRNGVLYNKDMPVDLVYRRGTIADWTKNLDRVQSLVQAYRDGAVCVVNPPRSKVGGMKSMLSVLTDDAMKHLFTEEELEVIAQHIPWTRFVRPGETLFHGEKISLIDFITANKDILVLKPNSQYGGIDVTIGREVSQEDWNTTLQKALTTRWVVQEYVTIPTLELPLFDPSLRFASKKVNVNFFAFNGKYIGAYVRTSDSSIINVARGGGQMPVFTIAGA